MNAVRSDRSALLALTGRDPGDAIVQATLVQQLQVLEVDPDDVVVAHASAGEPQPRGWFTDTRHCDRGGYIVRQCSLLWVVVNLLRTGSFAVVYARDVVTVQVALAARWLLRGEFAVIFDCRGDIAAEAQLRGRSRLRVALLNFLQKKSWRRADRLMVVSSALGEVVSKYAPRTPMIVVPNLQPRSLPLVDENPPRPLIAYAGGAQAWQDTDRVMSDLANLREVGIDVEVITRDENLRKQALDFDFTVTSGDRAHVLTRLQRATGSWMVRADAAANQVASPVKLGEALSAGAIVIGSRATWEEMPALVSESLAVEVTAESDRLESLIEELQAVWQKGLKGRAERLEVVDKRWTLRSRARDLDWFFRGPIEEGALTEGRRWN